MLGGREWCFLCALVQQLSPLLSAGGKGWRSQRKSGTRASEEVLVWPLYVFRGTQSCLLFCFAFQSLLFFLFNHTISAFWTWSDKTKAVGEQKDWGTNPWIHTQTLNSVQAWCQILLIEGWAMKADTQLMAQLHPDFVTIDKLRDTCIDDDIHHDVWSTEGYP